MRMERNITFLEEVLLDLRNISNVSLEEDIELLRKGWIDEKSVMMGEICKQSKHDIENVYRNLEIMIDNLKKM